MNKKFLIIIFFFLLSTNAFAFITYKQSKVVTSDSDQIRGIQFKPDGTIMYVSERETDPDTIMQYSLSTPFDISTATFQFKTTLTNITLPHAIEFHPNGTKMYVVNNTGTKVEQYTLTTAWDTSTLDHYGTYNVSNEDQLRALAFKPDGTRMYVTGADNFKIKQYSLSTAWDVTTATNPIDSSSLESNENNPRNIQFHSDGTIMYLGGNGGDDINKYTLSTPWDITTLTLSQTYSFSDQAEDMRGFIFAANFTKLYITNDVNSGANTIFEYSTACSGTITCSDPKDDNTVVAIMEAHVELTKRIIKQNTIPIMHRIEWLRRHRNKDNLKNQKLKVTIADEQLSKLVDVIKPKLKNNSSTVDEDEWFKWNEGRINIGKIKSSKSSQAKKFLSNGFAIGADKKKNKDTMYGYVFQLSTDKVNIGDSKEVGLFTKAYSISMYGTKIRDNSTFTDGLIGFGILDIDHKRRKLTNDIEGQRDGKQLFGSVNLGKRFNTKKFNLNPSVKINLGYTELEAFKEYINISDSLADQLYIHKQEIVTGLATIGVLLDKTIELNEKIINHNGRLEYIADFSPSTEAEFYYLNDASTKYKLTIGNKSEDNYRIGYGFDVTSLSGWSVIANFERLIAIGSGYVNEIYLSAGYVPLEGTKFAFNLINNNNMKTGFDIVKNINGFNLKFNIDADMGNNNKNSNILINKSF